MSNKIIIVWLILLTAWVVYNDIERYKNLQIRHSQVLIRTEKFDEINANIKSLEQYINGPLIDKLNKIGKYSHKH